MPIPEKIETMMDVLEYVRATHKAGVKWHYEGIPFIEWDDIPIGTVIVYSPNGYVMVENVESENANS